MKKVVITGIGAVTPLADNFHDSWKLVKAGTSGIDGITKFDCSNLKWRVAGEIKKFNPEQYLTKKEILHLDPFIHYSTSAALMAIEDSSLLTNHSSLVSGGAIIGSSRGGITTIEKAIKGTVPDLRTERSGVPLYRAGVESGLSPSSAQRLSSYLMPSTTISMAASHIAQKIGIKGPCLGISNACASGTNAIGEAFRMIRYGQAGLILAGGTDAPLCGFCIQGYGSSGALSRNFSRPFDRERDGFVLAEGACVLVLEEYSAALKRNARIYGEIIGYSNTTDAFHITKPDMEGEARAMLTALEDAGIEPAMVDYINAHGTSTLIGDKTEAAAIKKVFKDRCDVPVSSIKSMTGHMLAASGAFETACTVMSIQEGVIPPTINISGKDPECDINVITEKTEITMDIAISNSFGFGGVNAVLVLKKKKN